MSICPSLLIRQFLGLKWKDIAQPVEPSEARNDARPLDQELQQPSLNALHLQYTRIVEVYIPNRKRASDAHVETLELLQGGIVL